MTTSKNEKATDLIVAQKLKDVWRLASLSLGTFAKYSVPRCFDFDITLRPANNLKKGLQ